MMRVFKDHQLVRSHPEAVNVRINETGQTELLGRRGEVLHRYEPADFSAIGNVIICGGQEGDPCPICERLQALAASE